MNKKLPTIIASVIVLLAAFAVEKFVPQNNVTQNSSYSQTYLHNEGGINRVDEVYDTSRIWSRGVKGNAAGNATYHFNKHAHEFGFKTEQEYVAAAVRFTSEPLLPNVITNIQRDSDVAYYNPKTAEYAVKTKRGFIRTYFKLNPKIHGYATNTEYFNAQAKVGSPPPENDR